MLNKILKKYFNVIELCKSQHPCWCLRSLSPALSSQSTGPFWSHLGWRGAAVRWPYGVFNEGNSPVSLLAGVAQVSSGGQAKARSRMWAPGACLKGV